MVVFHAISNMSIVYIKNSTTEFYGFLSAVSKSNAQRYNNDIMKWGDIFCGGCPKPEKRRSSYFFHVSIVTSQKPANKVDYFIVHKILIDLARWNRFNIKFWGMLHGQKCGKLQPAFVFKPKKRQMLHNGPVMRPTIINQAFKLRQCTNLGQLFPL